MWPTSTPSIPWLHRRAEGHQLHRGEPLGARGDRRQPDVRVDLGRAVAGEVLAGGEQPALARARDPRGAQPGDQRRVVAEGAGVDDRVARRWC
jgi:hypothetical protein